MTNAWSLLYDMMENEDILSFETESGDMKNYTTETAIQEDYFSGMHSQYYYDYDRYELDPNALSNHKIGLSPEADTKEIDLNLDATSKNGFWKYEEDLTMKEVRDYLSSTYKSHYTSPESQTQTLDLIESIGDAEPFCRSNAIKYLSRFGKKNGKSKQDILKAIHYCILLYHFSGLHKNTSTGYETF